MQLTTLPGFLKVKQGLRALNGTNGQPKTRVKVATVATLLNSGGGGGGGAHFGQTTTHPEDLELQLAAGHLVPFPACFFVGQVCEVG